MHLPTTEYQLLRRAVSHSRARDPPVQVAGATASIAGHAPTEAFCHTARRTITVCSGMPGGGLRPPAAGRSPDGTASWLVEARQGLAP